MKRKNQQHFHSSYNKLVNLVSFILFYFIIVGKKTITRNGKPPNGPNEQFLNGECERCVFFFFDLSTHCMTSLNFIYSYDVVVIPLPKKTRNHICSQFVCEAQKPKNTHPMNILSPQRNTQRNYHH